MHVARGGRQDVGSPDSRIYKQKCMVAVSSNSCDQEPITCSENKGNRAAQPGSHLRLQNLLLYSSF
jgi:hypothetical protein